MRKVRTLSRHSPSWALTAQSGSLILVLHAKGADVIRLGETQLAKTDPRALERLLGIWNLAFFFSPQMRAVKHCARNYLRNVARCAVPRLA